MVTLFQQSWADKMVERLRNVIERDSKKSKASPSDKAPEPKRRRKGTDLLRRYPVNSNAPTDSNENAETLELHKKAINAELAKAKPRDCVLLPLLRSTYGERRIFILNEQTSVQGILQEYKALSRPAVVSSKTIVHSCNWILYAD